MRKGLQDGFDQAEEPLLPEWKVVEEGAEQCSATALVIGDGEMHEAAVRVHISEEAGLEGETQHHVDLIEYCLSRRALFALLKAETTALESESPVLLAAHERYNADERVVRAAIICVARICATVKEGS